MSAIRHVIKISVEIDANADPDVVAAFERNEVDGRGRPKAVLRALVRHARGAELTPDEAMILRRVRIEEVGDGSD